MGYAQIPLIDADSLVYCSCWTVKDGEPVENALHTLKLKLEGIIDKFDRGLSYKCYLTGADNYRMKVATLKPYKGNRVQEKPPYYQEARDYLVKWWQAQIIDGMEADDAIGIEQYKYPDRRTCICSIDKDMLTIPGWHFNWRSGEHFNLSLEEADRNFYCQMLTGDPTDNIMGVKGIGPIKARRLLDPLTSEDEMRRAVMAEYKKHSWGSLSAEEAFHEIGTLLRIKRTEDEQWS